MHRIYLGIILIRSSFVAVGSTQPEHRVVCFCGCDPPTGHIYCVFCRWQIAMAPSWTLVMPFAGRGRWQDVFRKVIEEGTTGYSIAERTGPHSVSYVMQGHDWLDHFPEVKKHEGAVISRYPGLGDLCEKTVQGHYFTRLRALQNEEFNTFCDTHVPTTFVYPSDMDAIEQWMGQKKVTTVIVKPEQGSQGDGIFIAQKFRDLSLRCTHKEAVVQKYITKPFLLGGLKFDFRVYVCITGLRESLRALLCEEGLVRFCTEPYEDGAAFQQSCKHLTNYSVNKRSSAFVHTSTEETASKRRLSLVLLQLGEEIAQSFWAQLEEIVRMWVSTASPVLTATLRQYNRDCLRTPRCAQVLGFDVMLNSKGVLKLIEVNNSPSLSIDEVIEDEENGTCRCMEHHRVHRHQDGPVDVAVKTVVARGFLDMARGVDPPGWKEVAIDGPLLQLLTRLEDFFSAKVVVPRPQDGALGAVGVATFSGGSLRAAFAGLLQSKVLCTADLDLALVKLKNTPGCQRAMPRGIPAQMGLVNFLVFLEVLLPKTRFPSVEALLESLVGAHA